jgi:hypothetical protein
MTAIQVVVSAFVGRFGSTDIPSAAAIASPHGVARVGRTITVRDDHYRIPRVHWLPDSEDQQPVFQPMYGQPPSQTLAS